MPGVTVLGPPIDTSQIQDKVEEHINNQVNFNINNILRALSVKYPGLGDIVDSNEADIDTIRMYEPIAEHVLQTKVGGIDRFEDYLNKKLMSAFNITLDKLSEGNSKHFKITVDRKRIVDMIRDYANDIYSITPSILIPENGANPNDTEVFFQASDLTGAPGFVHESTDWQIATDSAFSSLVVNLVQDTTNKTTLTSNVPSNTVLYVRVKYHSANTESNWSQAVSFEVIPAAIDTPTITSPTNGETDVEGTATITSSPYSVVNHSEPHESTDWQIATDSGFTNIVYEKLNDTSNLTSIGQTIKTAGCEPATQHYVRCKYYSASYESPWSSAISFTTVLCLGFSELQKVVPPTAGADYRSGFFTAMSKDDNFMVVAMSYSTTAGLAIYKWNDSTESYDHIQTITGTGYLGRGETRFNQDGSILIAGAPYEDNGGNYRGSTYVYQWNSVTEQFDQIQKIIQPENPPDVLTFSRAAALSDDGSTLFVITDESSVSTHNLEAVYVFKWNSGTSQFDYLAKISDDTAHQIYFGISIDINQDGSIVVIGAPDSDTYGATYIYKWNSGTSQYDLKQKLINQDGPVKIKYGSGVAISSDGSKMVIGARGSSSDNNVGKIYFYTWNSGTEQFDILNTWSATGNLLASIVGDLEKARQLDMSSDGNMVLIHSGDDQAGYGGYILLRYNPVLNQYDYCGTGCGHDTTSYDKFGYSVGCGTKRVVFGATGDDDAGSASGSAYVFG